MSRGGIAFAYGAGAGLLGGALLVRYREDKRRAITLLLAGSQLAETSCGPVEYAAVGDWPPLLISPGLGGGYDQGLYLAALFRASGLQCIAVSRPGYLRTPLSAGRTPEEQAAVFAALLDSLGIKRVAVLGVSAGGPAAIEFATRYPDRCSALILASAVSRPRRMVLPAWLIRDTLLRPDFVSWLLNRIWERVVLARNGLDPRRLDIEARAIVRGLLQSDLTASLRRSGLLNDLAQVQGLPAYAPDALTVPTLVIHCPSDPSVPFAEAEQVARFAPQARLLAVQHGGQLCLVADREEVVPEVVQFVERYAL